MIWPLSAGLLLMFVLEDDDEFSPISVESSSYIKSTIERFLHELNELCWCFSFKLLSELCCLQQPLQPLAQLKRNWHHLTNAF